MRFCCSLRCHYLKCNSRKKEICEEIFGWLFCALYFCVSPFFVFCLIAAKKNRKESGTVKSWRESCALQMIAFFKVDDNRQRIEWNRERATTIMRQLIYVVMVHFPFFSLSFASSSYLGLLLIDCSTHINAFHTLLIANVQ